MISAIVAVDNNWGIGFNGDLLEHIPEDLEYFKQLTTGNIIIMGRKTWESLPKKPLPKRRNLVITSNPDNYNNTNEVNFFTLSQIKVSLLKDKDKNLNFFVIGGGQIYKELLPICDRVYVTKIFKDHANVDTYFPNIELMDNWSCIEQSEIKQYNDISYQFKTYSRIS